VSNLRDFLSEMGGAFTFVGNQYRLEMDGKGKQMGPPAQRSMA
jgi:predicted nuclease of restriction endonuclease-like (RecB) superfamily